MQSQNNPQISTFPVPFSKEQLRQDILNLFLLHLRTTHLWANEGALSKLVGGPVDFSKGLYFSDHEPSDYGLAYASIQDSDLAQALDQQYEYGFLGVAGIGREPMEDESIHTWVAAYLSDLSASHVVKEWDANGVDIFGSVARCLHTVELANARRMLEGHECFSYFDGVRTGGKEDATIDIDGLTVHQMALLAGMEEMTIRTAVSRKGAYPLQTVKENGRTLVKADVAKAWLKAKGRYVSITRQWAGGELNLEKTRFTDTLSLFHALQDRLTQLAITDAKSADVRERFHAALAARGFEVGHLMDAAALENTELMAELAGILDLPPALLILRAKEAVLHATLAHLAHEVKLAAGAMNPASTR